MISQATLVAFVMLAEGFSPAAAIMEVTNLQALSAFLSTADRRLPISETRSTARVADPLR
jgi:hypothetical protein